MYVPTRSHAHVLHSALRLCTCSPHTRSKQAVIAVAFYSTYGHVATLAESVIKGVEASGAIVKPYQM